MKSYAESAECHDQVDHIQFTDTSSWPWQTVVSLLDGEVWVRLMEATPALLPFASLHGLTVKASTQMECLRDSNHDCLSPFVFETWVEVVQSLERM